MDAFCTLEPHLIELMRKNLAKTFPPHEMRLDAVRQRWLIIVEMLLLSRHFSTCSEEEVAEFMAVLADLSFDQMHTMQLLVAGHQILPSNVDLTSCGDSPSSLTDSSPKKPSLPQMNPHPADVALMEDILLDGLLDQDSPLNQDERVNTGGNASIDATHGSASMTKPSSSFSATEPSFANLAL